MTLEETCEAPTVTQLFYQSVITDLVLPGLVPSDAACLGAGWALGGPAEAAVTFMDLTKDSCPFPVLYSCDSSRHRYHE